MKNLFRIVALVLALAISSAAVAAPCAPPIEDSKTAPAKKAKVKKHKKAKKAKAKKAEAKKAS